MADRRSEHPRRARAHGCPECGVPCAASQRYCLGCGARLGSLPAPVAAQVALARSSAAGRGAASIGIAAAAAGTGSGKAAGGSAAGIAAAEGWPAKRSSFMPSPRAAATAVIGMLALGVAIGSATDQIAQSAGIGAILLEESSPPPAEETPETASAEPETAPGGEAAAPVASSAPLVEEPLVEEPLAEEPAPEIPEIPEELPTGLPEVKHVFVIMLGENGYEETFGEASLSKFLSEELPAQGEVLSNYFAVTGGELANQIALLSGQGPTPETAADCPNYGDLAPGTESPDGQVEGNGCVYPAVTKTLPGQLTEKGLAWRAYVEGMESGAAAGEPSSCRHPQLNAPDSHHAPLPGDPYLTWRDPFVYFHSIVDSPGCAEADVGLPQLTADLKLKPQDFPALAYLVPGACHKGGEAPCEPNAPSGPAASEEFLRTVVGQIKESLAYKDGGLIVITSAEARQGGPAPDRRSCCIDPAYPNLPPPPEAPASGPTREEGGGGQVGAILISPFVAPGTKSETYFNHYSLLVTIEELFGLERIGYAAEPALVGFDESIFNASS